MLAKYTIERQLKHFKAACSTDAAETAIWIKALEWVLGDDAHRLAYDEWVTQLMSQTTPAPDRLAEKPGELLLRHSLLMALERLR